MSRLVRFEEHRWVGDKRSFVVHDQDHPCDRALLEEIAAEGVGLCFGPDSDVEARNRGYKVCPACRAAAN